WPGTKRLVYRKGWLDRFMRALLRMVEQDEIRMVTYGTALRELPSAGIAYLASASYREMEEWALPPEAFQRLERLKSDLGKERASGDDAGLIRGSHWRNFMVRYPEANRMHKKAVALSELCRERGNSEGARRAIGRAQCNDAYWHGVFGGLYLTHLRDAVWANLAAAEGELRQGEPLQFEMRDVDLDGHIEVSIHSSRFAAVVSPARSGQVEELTFFGPAVNAANTLTRRREAYHLAGALGQEQDGAAGDRAPDDEEHTPSIHEIEGALIFAEPPPVDPHDRAIFVESLLPPEASEDAYRRGEVEALASWAGRPLTLESVHYQTAPDEGAAIRVVLSDAASGFLEKSLTFLEDGSLEVHYRWEVSTAPAPARFATEISLSADMTVTPSPKGEVWSFPVTTFSKSERGFDETIQGTNVTILWPAETGEARVRIEWPSPPASREDPTSNDTAADTAAAAS
ncbi:alpha-amylase/4-alpha-glucanotransferase domain-containing protein, partial [Gemmatimonadota bacterium]